MDDTFKSRLKKDILFAYKQQYVQPNPFSKWTLVPISLALIIVMMFVFKGMPINENSVQPNMHESSTFEQFAMKQPADMFSSDVDMLMHDAHEIGNELMYVELTLNESVLSMEEIEEVLELKNSLEGYDDELYDLYSMVTI